MKVILNKETSPHLNLATEEYLLSFCKDEDIVMLWRNDRSVIIGQNQNAYREVRLDYAKEKGISVVRRLTGGGAVFHDLGNINFTYITDYKNGDFGNYKTFAEPICQFLKGFGLSASVSGRNDIEADGFKISGNAQTVKGNRILYHGTLLYSADMRSLADVLSPSKSKFEDKAVNSVRARVKNINQLCETGLSAEEFMIDLYKFFLEKEGAIDYSFSESELKEIKKISREKYESWEWNFAASPNCNTKREQKFPFGLVCADIEVSKGVIKAINLSGDFFGRLSIDELCCALVGVKFDENEVFNVLNRMNIDDYISGATAEDLNKLIFKNE